MNGDRRVHLASEFGEREGFILKFPTNEALRDRVKDTFLLYEYFPSVRGWWVGYHDAPKLAKFAMEFGFEVSKVVLDELRKQSLKVLELRKSQASHEKVPEYKRRELEGDDRPTWAKKYWKVIELSYTSPSGVHSVGYIKYLQSGVIEGAPRSRKSDPKPKST